MTKATRLGGSFPLARRTRGAILATALLALVAALFVSAASARAELVAPGGFSVTTSTSDAGAHPDVTANIEVSSDENGVPEELAKEIVVDLPPGFTGYSAGIPRCSVQLFTASLQGGVPCPVQTQIGLVQLTLSAGFGKIPIYEPVYNLVPDAGQPAKFGFPALSFFGVQGVIDVRPGDYGLRTTIRNISSAVYFDGSKLTLWGVPADSSHNTQRGECVTPFGFTGGECSPETEPRAFITNPTACTGGLTATLHMDSYNNRGAWASDGSPDFSDPNWQADTAEVPAIENCDKPAFEPTLQVRPTVTQSDSPSGYTVTLDVPQTQNPEGVASANLRNAVVTLPDGVNLSPSAADGLGACSDAQLGIGSAAPPSCPNASRIGEATLDTPAFTDPLTGTIYVGEPKPGDPYRIFLTLAGQGVRIKVAGSAQADPATGRLVVHFDDNPQQPFSELKLVFKNGSRAPLTTPPTCGSFQTTSQLTPWSAPEGKVATPADSFQIESGPHGMSCAKSAAEEPNAPSFEAGTLAPIGGTFSPFTLHLSREDGSQRLAAIEATLPPGLLAKLAGVPHCSDSALAAAAAKTGGQEQASPSCPAASEIGNVQTLSGPGVTPFGVAGKAYLAGPYKGAPLSVATIVPAVAGPYDLGTVVVRSSLQIDPESAQASAASDPLPQVLAGVPLDLRRIGLNLDRPQFTLNPTSCEPLAITGNALSALGSAAPLSQRFQAGACAALGFKPRLALRLSGKTNRGANPALRATLRMPAGNADIARAAVTLPHSEFLDQGHINTICTRVQFSQDACPAGSVYGHARAFSPLLDQPLEGPVYLRSSSHNLPDLVADLHGQIHIVLDGRIDSVRGGIRTSFESVPDAPVSKFVLEMKGGKKGLLQNSTDICAGKHRATVRMDAHSGRVFDGSSPLRASCRRR